MDRAAPKLLPPARPPLRAAIAAPDGPNACKMAALRQGKAHHVSA